MYNEDLKMEYINSCYKNKSVEFVCRVFNSTEKIEGEIGKDIYEIDDAYDMQRIINRISGVRSGTADIMSGIIKNYIKWCKETKGIKTIGTVENIDIDINIVRSVTVQNPLHLQKYLNGIYCPEDKRMVDMIYRCIFWMAYAGISDDDIYEVTSDEVNIDKMVIIHKNSVYPLYKEGKKTIEHCKNATYFNYDHPLYSETITRDRVPGNILIRGVKGSPNKSTNAAQISRRLNDYGGPVVNVGRTRLSGVFYRMYEREIEGLPVDFISVIKSGIFDVRSISKNKDAKDRIKANNLKRDYNNWKMAYNLI